MFRALQRPSSGVLKTVGSYLNPTDQHIPQDSLTLFLIRKRRKQVAAPVLWPIPEVVVTVFSTPDDGCCDARNM
jgi:hypothetical protein